MPNNYPFRMNLKDLANVGPIPLIPNLEPEAVDLKLQDIDRKIRQLRDLASVGEVGPFVSYIAEQYEKAVAHLLFQAKTDSQRLEAQAYARVWLGIYRDLVTAAKQVGELEEKRKALSGQKA